MKLGILTQPLSFNYGCNLQAFALQRVLENMGHEVIILDRRIEEKRKTFIEKVQFGLKNVIKDAIRLLLNKPIYHTIKESNKAYFGDKILSFQNLYFKKSSVLKSTHDIAVCVKALALDGIVVGSDQVWRPAYNIDGMLENMFLDFAEDSSLLKIAYAASFGVSEWEYTIEQTKRCANLIKKFDAVSVREDSGVFLCKEYLNREASHVLDPTLLLDKAVYEHICLNNHEEINGSLFCYILDNSSIIKGVIKKIENQTGLQSYMCLPSSPEGCYNVFNKKESVFPSIEYWLACFSNASLVLVDSFHGAVFSIIFNKEFWVIGNKRRGMARFTSLLKTFGIENRMIDIDEISKVDLTEKIDWERVNSIRESEKEKSISFLYKAKALKEYNPSK